MKLIINEFGPIKNTEFDVKDFNVIIGKSATGKSLIAKLISIFYEVTAIFFGLKQEENWNFRFEKQILQKINEKFDKVYKNRNIIFEIENAFEIEIKNNVKINFISKKLKTEIESSKKDYYEIIKPYLNDEPIYTPIYFPAGRIFISNLSENPFSFSNTLANLDDTIIKFGELFQFYKRKFGKKDNFELLGENKNLLKSYFKELLKGNYRFEKDEDRFYFSKDRYLPINKISSGQQELLPALAVLWGILQKETKPFIIFEEPEVHIFPDDQKLLLELLVLITKIKKGKLLITTHSPYTLSVFNNLIEAHNIFIANKDNEKEIDKVIKKDLWIDFNKINVVEITQRGRLKSILNKKERLIDTNAIDKVSEKISEEYEKLLDIQFGTD